MNHFDIVIKDIRNRENTYDEKASCSYAMLRHFIELMGDEGFNNTFEAYFLDKDHFHSFEASFYDFHKSMRQTDFYDRGEGSGHIDMLFWYYIHISDKCFDVLKAHFDKITNHHENNS